MTKPDYTHLRDQTPSLIHRTLGSACYMTDLDSLHYTYKNNQLHLIALIDWKNGLGKKFGTEYSAIQAQIALANKADLSFYIVYTYLDPALFPIAAMYVIPINDKAKQLNYAGWMTLQQYSRFEHALRGLPVNEDEICFLSDISITYQLPEDCPIL